MKVQHFSHKNVFWVVKKGKKEENSTQNEKEKQFFLKKTCRFTYFLYRETYMSMSYNIPVTICPVIPLCVYVQLAKCPLSI